jgi:hypothetical protein
MSDQDYLRDILGRPPGASDKQDELYLKIWELEQQQSSTRWTVATFFLSISFAIFGFSFQSGLAAPLSLIARISGLAIYCFAYALYNRFNTYTRFLRGFLRELETSQRTTLDVQTRVAQQFGSRHGSATRLLAYFGLLYVATIAALWWFGL